MCLPVKPYKVEREWEAFGLRCAVTPGPPGTAPLWLCPSTPSHPCYAEWSKSEYSWHVDLDVHGGVTFCQLEECTHQDGIGLWIGFDFAHAGDAMYDPRILLSMIPDSEPGRKELAMLMAFQRDYPDAHKGEHYWTFDEVVAETEKCAQEVAAMKGGQVVETEGLSQLDKS